MLKSKIQESTFGTQKINRILTNVLSYDLGTDDCRLRYELRFRDSNNSPAVPDDIITSGIWKVPQEILNGWTGRNEFLAEKLCEFLGYTIIKHLSQTEVD